VELERCVFCESMINERNVKECQKCKIRYCIYCAGERIENPDLCEVCKVDLLNDMFSPKNK
jgi:hypothetical protein